LASLALGQSACSAICSFDAGTLWPSLVLVGGPLLLWRSASCPFLSTFPFPYPLLVLFCPPALLPSCPSAKTYLRLSPSSVLRLPNGRPLWSSALGTLHKCPWSHWSPAAARHRWCSALGHPASLTFSALRRSASPALSAVIVAMLVCLRACFCLCACLRL